MLIFTACLTIFIYGMVASMLGTIIPGLAVRFALSNVQVSYIALAQGIGLALASVAVGALMDEKGKKIGLLLGLGLIIIGLLQLTHPLGMITIMVSMFVVGMGGSIVIVGANALGSDVSNSKRGAMLNFLNIFVGLGGLATPFVAGNLLDADPTKVAYTALGITILALVITALTKIPTRTHSQRSSNGQSASGLVFREPILYVLAGIIFLYTACEFGIWNWLPKFLITRGIPSSTALNILGLGFALGLLFGRIIAANVLTKVSPFVVSLTAALIMALSTFLLLRTHSVFLTALVVFCSGLAMAPVFPTTLAIVGNIFPNASGRAMGFTITCGFSGLVVSSPLIGWLSGGDPGGLARGLLLIPAFALLIAALYVGFRSQMISSPVASALVSSSIDTSI